MRTCQSSNSAIHELRADRPIHPSIAHFLLPQQVLTDQLTSAMAFQFEQMSLRIQNLRVLLESQRKTLDGALPQLQSLRGMKAELSELTRLNQHLQLELDHRGTMDTTRAAPSVSHDTRLSDRPQQDYRHGQQPEMISHRVKRRVSLGDSLEPSSASFISSPIPRFCKCRMSHHLIGCAGWGHLRLIAVNGSSGLYPHKLMIKTYDNRP